MIRSATAPEQLAATRPDRSNWVGANAGSGGVSQALGVSSTVTGYQQTRNAGKLGRVTWHELFTP